MNIGLIGYGYWGKILLPKLEKLGKVKFICRSIDSYLDKLDNIDWVIVATPNQTHYEIVKNCLSKGVNVFCEKSLTLDYETSSELYQIAKNKNCNLYVDDVFIFRKQVSEIKESLANVEEFDVVWKKVGRSDYGEFIMSSLYSLAWHDFYLLYQCVGNKVSDIVKIDTKNKLQFSLMLNGKKINFIYDRLSKTNEHSINNVSLMHDGNDEDAIMSMFKHMFSESVDYELNKNYTLFAAKLIDRLRTELFKNVNIVGGGIFGVTCAWMLSKNGYFVNLYERTDDILKSASGINQYRLHRGYHYPRSYETAISSKEGQNGFLKYYGESILKEVENYYCIAKDESLVDKDTYIKFLDKLQLEYKEVDVDLTNDEALQLCLEVKESLFDSNKLREICWDLLGKYLVKVNLNTEFDVEDLDESLTINATYSLKNYLSTEEENLQFELCEKPVVKLPDKYKNKSFVVMDGPFMCIDPYGDTGYHVMGNVVHAIHYTNTSKFPMVPSHMKKMLNKGIIKNPTYTNIDKFKKTIKLFFKDVDSIEHMGSMFTFRTVLPNREFDDARPTVYKFEKDNLITIFSGKIGTCIDTAESIIGDLINE